MIRTGDSVYYCPPVELTGGHYIRVPAVVVFAHPVAVEIKVTSDACPGYQLGAVIRTSVQSVIHRVPRETA